MARTNKADLYLNLFDGLQLISTDYLIQDELLILHLPTNPLPATRFPSLHLPMNFPL